MQDKRPTVTVIIPYYNGSQWIVRAIESVITQTVQPDEFVIVNDGSTSEEREALTPLAEKYNFQIIDKANGGQGSARNLGVVATTSEYISFLDQDDYYLPHHIEDLLNAIPKSDLRFGYVYADLLQCNGNGDVLDSSFLRKQIDHGHHPRRGHITALIGQDLFVLPSASLIRREAFQAVGGFDVQFRGYEDDDLFLRLFSAGYTNYFVDKPVTAWCMHVGSTTYSLTMSKSRFKYFKKILAVYSYPPPFDYNLLNDVLIPRFTANFINEAHKGQAEKSPSAHEFLAILVEFSDIVSKSNAVSTVHRKNIQRNLTLLTGNQLQKKWAKVTMEIDKWKAKIRRRLARLIKGA
jgi:glycosyltransferase involved in cell wall biosynthesis